MKESLGSCMYFHAGQTEAIHRAYYLALQNDEIRQRRHFEEQSDGMNMLIIVFCTKRELMFVKVRGMPGDDGCESKLHQPLYREIPAVVVIWSTVALFLHADHAHGRLRKCPICTTVPVYKYIRTQRWQCTPQWRCSASLGVR